MTSLIAAVRSAVDASGTTILAGIPEALANEQGMSLSERDVWCCACTDYVLGRRPMFQDKSLPDKSVREDVIRELDWEPGCPLY